MSKRRQREHKNMIKCTLFCQECGSKASIMRLRHNLKTDGHIKDLYCFSCQNITKHREEGQHGAQADRRRVGDTCVSV